MTEWGRVHRVALYGMSLVLTCIIVIPVAFVVALALRFWRGTDGGSTLVRPSLKFGSVCPHLVYRRCASVLNEGL